jgi:hypothetical protein
MASTVIAMVVTATVIDAGAEIQISFNCDSASIQTSHDVVAAPHDKSQRQADFLLHDSSITCMRHFCNQQSISCSASRASCSQTIHMRAFSFLWR